MTPQTGKIIDLASSSDGEQPALPLSLDNRALSPASTTQPVIIGIAKPVQRPALEKSRSAPAMIHSVDSSDDELPELPTRPSSRSQPSTSAARLFAGALAPRPASAHPRSDMFASRAKQTNVLAAPEEDQADLPSVTSGRARSLSEKARGKRKATDESDDDGEAVKVTLKPSNCAKTPKSSPEQVRARQEESAAKKQTEKASKARNAALRAANKLQSDRKIAVKYVRLLVTEELATLPSFKTIFASVKQTLGEAESLVRTMPCPVALRPFASRLLFWERHHDTVWNEAERIYWPLPDEEHGWRPEPTLMIYVTAAEASLLTRKVPDGLTTFISSVKAHYPDHQLFLLLHGLATTEVNKQQRDTIRAQLMSAFLATGCKFLDPDDDEALAATIVDASRDISVRQLKLHQQEDMQYVGHVPEGQRKGDGPRSTFLRQLSTMPGGNETAAAAIVHKYKTWRGLYEAFEAKQYKPEELLANEEITRTAMGTITSRQYGVAASTKLYRFMFSSDPHVQMKRGKD